MLAQSYHSKHSSLCVKKLCKHVVKKLIDQGLKVHVRTEKLLARILEGTRQRRYGLVNRAIKAGELNRLSRGRPEFFREELESFVEKRKEQGGAPTDF